MNNAQVAHRWASRNFNSGKGSNFYFEDARLFSYGPHYVVAVWTNVVTASGFPVVLENSRGYSMTTQRHHSMMRQALRGLPSRVIEVPCVSAEPFKSEHADNLAYMQGKFERAILAAGRARKNVNMYLDGARNAQNDAHDYCAAFGLELPAFATEAVSDELLARALATEKAEKAAAREAEKRREELRAKSYAEKIEAWRNGADANECELWRFAGEDTELRMSKDGKRVETSRGAEVTVTEARRLFKLLRQVIGTHADMRAGVRAAMPKISGFDVRDIALCGDITIGCHVLKWHIVEPFAKSQGS